MVQKMDFIFHQKNNQSQLNEEDNQTEQYTEIQNDDTQIQSYIFMVERYYNERLKPNLEKQQKLDGENSIEANVYLHNLDQPSDLKDVSKINESFNITIQSSQIDMSCHGYVSFLRAIETLYQLIDSSNYIQTPQYISDKPSLRWRGISYDTARRFIPIEILEKHLDAMRIVKLNVMQIHFTDSESFPIEIPSIPELSQYGAYSQDKVYTASDIQRLQKYAQQNGVQLIPEYDSPAHTRSWSQSKKYEDAGACPNTTPKAFWTYCLQPPCGNIDPTSDKTWEIIDAIFNYTQHAFDSDIIHLGGDEVKSQCWDRKPSIKEYMEQNDISNYKVLETWYKQKLINSLPKNKRAIFWSSGSQNLPLSDNDILQFWGSPSKSLKNEFILSPNKYLYLDCGRGNPIGSNRFWCDPFKTWYRIYKFNPLRYSNEKLLGVTAPLWMETVSPEELDSMIFPRAISLALRLWNAKENLGIQELAQKIIDQNNRLKKYLNMNVGAIGSQYCEKNVKKCYFEGKIDLPFLKNRRTNKRSGIVPKSKNGKH